MWHCEELQGLRLLAREEKAACLSVLTGDGDMPGKPRTLHCGLKNKERERDLHLAMGGRISSYETAPAARAAQQPLWTYS